MKMVKYDWKIDKTKMLRMLRNSRTNKMNKGWSRYAGAGFIIEDIREITVNFFKEIMVETETFTMVGKTGRFNLRETEEMIRFLER